MIPSAPTYIFCIFVFALSKGNEKAAAKNPATAEALISLYFKISNHQLNINYINLVEIKSLVLVYLFILSFVSSNEVSIPKFIDIALQIVGTIPVHNDKTPSVLIIVVNA